MREMYNTDIALKQALQPHLDFADCKLCNRERVVSQGELKRCKSLTL